VATPFNTNSIRTPATGRADPTLIFGAPSITALALEKLHAQRALLELPQDRVPRFVPIAADELPEQPLESRSGFTVETVIPAAAGILFLYGPARLARTALIAAGVLVPTTVEELTAFNVAKKNKRIETVFEKATGNFTGERDINPQPPKPPAFPTLGAQIVEALGGELAHTALGQAILDFYGVDNTQAAQQILDAQRQATTRRPVTPADLPRFTPQALQKVIAALEGRGTLTPSQALLLGAARGELQSRQNVLNAINAAKSIVTGIIESWPTDKVDP